MQSDNIWKPTKAPVHDAGEIQKRVFSHEQLLWGNNLQIKQLFDLFGFAYIIIGVIVTIINIINIVTWSPVISVKDSEEKQKLKRGKSKDENWENLSKRNEVAYDINELRGMPIILKRKGRRRKY